MASPVTGNELGSKLCKLFKLPKHTNWFELRVAHDEIVTINCAYYPDKNDLAGIDLVTAKFELIEIEDEVLDCKDLVTKG